MAKTEIKMETKEMRAAFCETLMELAEENQKLILSVPSTVVSRKPI